MLFSPARLLLPLAILLASPLSAQPQAPTIPAEAVARFERALAVAGLVDNIDVPVTWLGTDGAFAFARTVGGERRWFLMPAGSATPTAIALPDGGHPLAVTGGTADAPIVATAGGPLRLDRSSNSTQALPQPGKVGFIRHLPLFDQRVPADVPNPAGAASATVAADGNLALRNPDGSLRPLTADAAPRFGWDLEAPGPIGAGSAISPWSPDGRHLYAARLDRRMATDLPVFAVTGPAPSVSQFGTWMAGKPLPTLLPEILDVETGARLPLQLGSTADAHIRLVGWQADGKALFLARASRHFDRLEILRADAATGTVTTVATERHPDGSFVRMLHDFIYGGPTGVHLLADGGFLLLSERDGWNHVYRYNARGRQIARLTSGAFPVHRILAVDEANNRLLLQAATNPARPTDTDLHMLPLSGGRLVRLGSGEGAAKVRLSPARDRAVVTRSTPSAPGETRLVAIPSGATVATLASPTVDRLQAQGWAPPQQVSARVTDGEDRAWGVLYRPADFDPSRRYPVIEYIYAGPQTSYAPATFTAEAFRSANLPQALAELGFIVVTLDTRGTPGRSRQWHQFTVENWDSGVIADHAAALKDLARTRPWMDMSRVGVFGHSWGGYQAFMALVRQPETYRAAVSSGPGYIDSVSAMDEAYWGDPATHAQRYAPMNPYQYADRIQPDTLMLMSGTVDQMIWPLTLRMSDLLIKRGVRHQVVPLPDQGHGFSMPGYEYAGRRIADFFADRLLGAPPISWPLPPAPAR